MFQFTVGAMTDVRAKYASELGTLASTTADWCADRESNAYGTTYSHQRTSR